MFQDGIEEGNGVSDVAKLKRLYESRKAVDRPGCRAMCHDQRDRALQASHGQRSDAHQVTWQVDDSRFHDFGNPAATRRWSACLAARNFDRSASRLGSTRRVRAAGKWKQSSSITVCEALYSPPSSRPREGARAFGDQFDNFSPFFTTLNSRPVAHCAMVRSPSEKVADQ